MSENYKVLFVGPYPPPYAGPEISMKYLLESPLTKRFDVSFLNTNFRKSNAKKGNIDIFLVGAFFSFVARLMWMLATRRPSLVYSFVTATRLGWLGRDIWCIAISRLFGRKVVLHMRGGHFKINYDASGRLAKEIIRGACSFVSCGIVQAKGLRNQFEGLIPEERIVVIHNAVDCDQYAMHNPADYDRNMVLFMGHLSPSKGYCDLLKVIPDVVRACPDVVFHFAGTKIKKETNVKQNQLTGEQIFFEDPEVCFERYIKGRCEKNYVYHGIADENAKLELLRKCNFFVLPSYSEGFSMAVLEALSMGKPIVTTPVGALGEVIRHEVNGLLCRPGDLVALKNNILIMLNNAALREQISIENKEYVRQNFTIEVISQKLGDCFASLLIGEGK